MAGAASVVGAGFGSVVIASSSSSVGSRPIRRTLRAINPMSVEGQVEGATSQGLGYALCEEYLYDEEGRMLNPDLMDFRLPTAADHPEYAIDLIEERRDAGPYGAKGVGEPPLVPTAPAIANAIFNATGARVKQIPITPERLYQALRVRHEPGE